MVSLSSSLYETALEMITVQPSDAEMLQKSESLFSNRSLQDRTALSTSCSATRSGRNCTQHALASSFKRFRCGHVFLRRPIFTKNGSLLVAMHNLSSASHTAFSVLPLRRLGSVIRRIAFDENVSCLELNYDVGRSRVPTRNVIATLNSATEGQVPVLHLQRAPGTAPNAWAIKHAAGTSILITELGTQWTDFPLEKRCTLGLRSFVLAVAPCGRLLHAPVSCNSARVAQYGVTIPFSRGRDPATNWCEQHAGFGFATHFCPNNTRQPRWNAVGTTALTPFSGVV